MQKSLLDYTFSVALPIKRKERINLSYNGKSVEVKYYTGIPEKISYYVSK